MSEFDSYSELIMKHYPVLWNHFKNRSINEFFLFVLGPTFYSMDVSHLFIETLFEHDEDYWLIKLL